MHEKIFAIAYYTFLESLRTRLPWMLAAMALALFGMAGFFDQLAITESRQIQAALLGALARLAAVFVIATFVVTSMLREAHDKGLELLLALPLPRFAYLLGKLAGYSAVACAPALVFGALMLLFAPPLQVGLWSASLWMELCLLAAMALLCALTFRHATAALAATLTLYLGARTVVTVQAMAQSVTDGGATHELARALLGAVATILPRLEEFTRTDWLVYHSGSLAVLAPLAAQALLFLLLVLAASLVDLYRKNI